MRPFIRCCLIATVRPRLRACEIVGREMRPRAAPVRAVRQQEVRSGSLVNSQLPKRRGSLKAQAAAALELQVDVIVRAVRGAAANSAGCLTCRDARAACRARAEQQVLAAPLERVDALAGEPRGQRLSRSASATAARGPRRPQWSGRRTCGSRPRRVVSTSGARASVAYRASAAAGTGRVCGLS